MAEGTPEDLKAGLEGDALQSIVIVALALAIGVTFAGGVLGVAVLVLIGGLLGTAFAALSNALALVARRVRGRLPGARDDGVRRLPEAGLSNPREIPTSS